jgi:ABC-2 type transport system permease protein
MNTTFAETAGETPRSASAYQPKPLATTLLTLIRREFWEHRYLWLAPLATQLLMLFLCAVLGHYHVSSGGDFSIDMSRDGGNDLMGGHDAQVAAASVVQVILAVPLYVVTLFLLSYYALDCLYAERRDRSILFWKSLPVSDGLTVTAKALTALVVVPFGVFTLALVGHLFFYAILSVRLALGSVPPVLTWDTLEWLRTEAVLFLITLLTVLWYAPVVTLLMLVSAWVRWSVPFLWVTVPPVLALILESILHRVYGQPEYLHSMLSYRTHHIWDVLGVRDARVYSAHVLHPIGSLLQQLNFGAAFADRDLWLGVLVAIAMLVAAARLRRYHDES